MLMPFSLPLSLIITWHQFIVLCIAIDAIVFTFFFLTAAHFDQMVCKYKKCIWMTESQLYLSLVRNRKNGTNTSVER